ncbi:hypothetical protein AVO45_13435 [Ruegeria marisrubri]|uniref:Uncharacterized protein n=1 Tax=Ruegeria marisrubri TaxID=1685379 RepID=A0A0X3TKW7_9RHOB|nr:hypothetical protein AVO45_13435 [Ruegeria marisrubri]
MEELVLIFCLVKKITTEFLAKVVMTRFMATVAEIAYLEGTTTIPFTAGPTTTQSAVKIMTICSTVRAVAMSFTEIRETTSCTVVAERRSLRATRLMFSLVDQGRMYSLMSFTILRLSALWSREFCPRTLMRSPILIRATQAPTTPARVITSTCLR